jgi:hypothetical protein
MKKTGQYRSKFLLQKNLMKLFCLSFLVTFSYLRANAQAFPPYVVTPVWAWGHHFNGLITSIEYHNNFIYTTGSFSDSAFIFGNVNIPNNGGKDVVIAKWDTLGNLLWATSIFGTLDEYAVSIKVNNNNEVVVAGYSNSSTVNTGGNLLNSNGGYDTYIAKYNQNGTIINSYIYGTPANEGCIDMCTDYSNHIYILEDGGLSKYNSNGIFISQAAFAGAIEIDYSSFDSTIVLTGVYYGPFTLGNFTIFADGNGANTYCAKISPLLGVLWLKAIGRGNIMGQYSAKTTVDEMTGHTFVGRIAYYQITLGHMIITGITPAGTMYIAKDDDSEQWNVDVVSSISSKSPYISVALEGNLNSITVYDLNNGPPYFSNGKRYLQSGSGGGLPKFQFLKDINAIYTLGYENNNLIKFGKIGHEILNSGPSNQTLTDCAGNTMTLNGNITDGAPPLTYSWLPVTGLNNNNTNSVSFTATSNISYTLTVIDAIGQVKKDTFNIVVDNLIPAANITSQYPTFCDSMKLYSNNGVAGAWYKLNFGNQWQFIANDTSIMIYSAGKYRYEKSNTCNVVVDTIDIVAPFTVIATATSDSVCAGQSVTLTASGALIYSWTGGVSNNVPFNPLATQIYVVTGTDANGCTSTSFVQIVINNSNINLVSSICANQTPYIWNGQSYDSTGVYTANYTNIYGCDSVITLNLTVTPCIICVPSIQINNDTVYYSLLESQTWIQTGGIVIIEAGSNVKFDAAANYFVKLNPGFKAEYGSVFVAQAYNGCTPGAPQLPNAKIFTGETMTVNEIVLFPNPTTGMIHIQHDEKLSDIQIFDMVGKLIINQKCNGETETNINLSHLPNGVYHVKAAGYQSVKVVKND